MKYNKVIFICGPSYGETNWETEKNAQRMEELSFEIWKLGACALNPLSNIRQFRGSLSNDNLFTNGNIELLKRCDAVMCEEQYRRYATARTEHEFAKSNNISIFYDIPDLEYWLEQTSK